MTTVTSGAAPANPPRRLLAVLEPWYDWGGTSLSRLDTDDEGDGRFFQLQWLGLSITVFYGRTPPKREG